MPRNKIVIIAFILALAALKIYFLFQFSLSAQAALPIETVKGDIGHYLQIGKNLSDFGVYGDNQSPVPTESATWRAPVWPAILSVFFLVSNKQIVLLGLKMLIELAIGFWALTRLKEHYKLGDNLYCLLFLVFFEPQFVKYSANFLTESLSAVLIFALAVSFMTSVGKRVSYDFTLLCVIAILCHPVSIFFVATLFAIYILKAGQQQIRRSAVSIVLFIALLLAWPLRNALTFEKGFYLTASHGATFSKGWNDNVAENFTNTRGDDADENSNLKYLTAQDFNRGSVIDMNQRFKEATMAFIDQASGADLASAAIKKISSNFNPFCETPKTGLLEKLGVAARLLYLFNFVLISIYFVKLRQSASPLVYHTFAVIAAVLVGQVAMSVYIYTGLRFNCIYGMTLLACSLLLASETIFKRFFR